MSAPGGFATPGFGAALYTTEREILWGRDDQHLPLLFRNSVIDGATRDAGNSPTTILRRGLILGLVTATKQQKEWVATNTDGTQNIYSVLNRELRAQDFDANNTDRAYATLLRAPVIAGQLLIQGSAFVGHIDEYLARRMMVAQGYVFDDDPQGFLAGACPRFSYETATTDALTADQNGTTLYYDNAASVTVTLPAVTPGVALDMIRVADEEFIVQSAEGDNIVVGGDLSADSVTFTTAGNQIGAWVRVYGGYLNTTKKWFMTLPPMPFGTGTATMAYAIGT